MSPTAPEPPGTLPDPSLGAGTYQSAGDQLGKQISPVSRNRDTAMCLASRAFRTAWASDRSLKLRDCRPTSGEPQPGGFVKVLQLDTCLGAEIQTCNRANHMKRVKRACKAQDPMDIDWRCQAYAPLRHSQAEHAFQLPVMLIPFAKHLLVSTTSLTDSHLVVFTVDIRAF